MLPQMRWRTVHAVGDTEMPLLPDEEEEVEAAAVVIIEAVHAARTAPPATVFDARVGKLVPQAREQVLYDPPPGGEADSDGDGVAKEYRVVHAPGVRCRADPSSEAAVTGVLRAGAVVSGSAAGPKGGWVQLSDGRGYARLHGTSGPLLSVAASSSVAAAAEAESEEDEVVREEKKVAWARAEREYLDGGVAAARGLLAHDALRALYRCHCAGGVAIAIDHACPLLGRAGNEADAETAACTEWPRLLPYIVGLPPVKPPAARHRVSWRRLRGAAARSAGQDCSLGFCAIGLPPGTAAAVHPAHGAALWPALGSAAPHKIGQLEAREREARVTAAQRARKVERERTKALGQLEEAFRQAALPWPPAEADGSGPQLDYAGVLRGQCLDTVGCSGYLPATHLAHAPSLAMLCVRCGCECSHHEVLRAPECPPANGAAE